MEPTQTQNQSADTIIMEIAEAASTLHREQAASKKTGNFLIDTYTKLNRFLANSARIKLVDKVVFYQLLAVLLNSGVPLVQSLYTIGEQFKNPKFKQIVTDLAHNVESGSKLSDGMSSYPKVFSDAQIGMINAGEVSGNMNDVLQETAKQMEATSSLASKVKGAMVYPIAIFSLLLIVSIVMMIYIIPKMTALFEGTGVELPAITKFFLAISDTLRNRGFTVLIVGSIFIFILIAWSKTPNGRYQLDRLKLHLPIFGQLLRNVALARFSRTLASLILSGIPIVKALQINAEAVGNAVYREHILEVAEDVQRGIPIAENLGANSFLFPPTVVNMVSIGEQTAQLDTVLSKIADFYEERVNVAVGSLSKLMEPLIMAFMGIMVGGVVLAVLMPMIKLTDLADVA